MATMLDLRRTDLRDSVYASPYWISSGRISATDPIKDKGAVLFSFPKAGQIILIHEVVFQVEVVFTAGTTCTIGSGSIATEAITTDGTVTNVDVDEYMLAADITLTTLGYYGPTTGTGSDWLTTTVSHTYAAPRFILGAAATVPVVYTVVTNAGAIAAGAGRLHMLITNIPGA
jgi:hypothetical protein